MLAAADGASPESTGALERLCRTYWYPLYAFVRRKGYSVEDAEDLVQDFFATLLEKGYVGRADPARGRFRTFLLTSMQNFLHNAQDRLAALKRGGGQRFFSWHIAAIDDPGSTAGGIGLTTPSPSAPIRFGDYEMLEEIGHGRMGLVYKARHLSLNRLVALKLLLPGPFSSPEMLGRFRREAQAAAALTHPGIVPVYEVGELNGQSFFSMEFVEGRSLASLISDLKSQISDFLRVAWWVKGIAEAIAHAHQHRIVHRDLKPATILIDLDDRVHVADFGLAKRLDVASDLTLTGQVLRSPDYLAPEQASGKHGAAQPASDIYLAGAILYELLTGRPPFRSSSIQDTLLRIHDSEPVAPRLLNGSVPRDLEGICLKCL